MSGTGYGGPVTEKERARITGDTRGLAIGVEEHGRSSDADAAGRPTQSENNGYAESGYDGGAQRGDDEEAGLVGRGAQLAATRRRDAQLWQGALALLIYAMSSSSLTFVNKTVLSTYDFHCTFLLLAVQLTFAIAVCSTASILPESCASLRPPKVTAQLLRESAKVSVCFVGNIAAGFYGLRVVNLPMFFCVRRTAVVFVLAAEVLFLKKKARADMLLAVVLIVAGTITAGLQDLNADLFGYGCVMVNNAMTALYLAVSKRFTMSTGVNALGLLYLNALVALPLVSFAPSSCLYVENISSPHLCRVAHRAVPHRRVRARRIRSPRPVRRIVHPRI